MVKLMKFTRDLCRLLGIGGDGPGEQEEMVVEGGPPGSSHGAEDNCLSQQDMLSGDDGLTEEERNRRRAERRRAKRKRQKERKKLEKEEKMEVALEQEDEDRGGVSESDSEEEEVAAESVRIVAPLGNKDGGQSSALVAAAGARSNKQPAEEEPEWDVSSAFVANAASHIRPKGLRSKAGHGSRENKENEARTSQVEGTDVLKRRGASLAEQGVRVFQQGQYTQAVDIFTAAIHCDPKDHRFFGNRSYCYWCLERYPSALSDAEKSIQLAPDWPKGYFRKGSALMGLKRYTEAEKAMEQVLKLDKQCKEASTELFNCRVLQLMERGFEEVQSILLLEKFTTVPAALASSDAARVIEHTSLQDQSGSPCPSLWVGNVTLDITEKHIWDLFKTCGEIDSIRVLHERFCAFVNFKNANMAAKALEKLQGVLLENSRLVIRYPDRWIQRTSPPATQRTNVSPPHSASGPQQPAATSPRRRAPPSGDECFFWRTTDCFYGDKCRFKHVPDQRRKDKKPWQP